MKNLLALLMYHTHNIHILHWKTMGNRFQPNHEYLDGLYQEMNGHIDLIAEMLLQRNQDPISYEEMLEIAKEKGWHTVQPNQYYDEPTTFTHAQDIFESIINGIDRLYLNDTINRAHLSELETMQSWYMLKARYLFKNRLVPFTKSAPEPSNASASESASNDNLFSQLNELLSKEE